MRPKVKPLTNEEIRYLIQDYKRKLWAHIEERQSHQFNQNFIAFAESQIEQLNKKLMERIAA